MMHQLPTDHTLVTVLHRKKILLMKICFRFDRSATNSNKQGYKPVNHSIFDPVDYCSQYHPSSKPIEHTTT